MNNNEDRLEELEQRVAELTALVERLTPAPSPAASGALPTDSTEHTMAPATATASRRGMLKLAGAAAVGTAAVALVGPSSKVAAVDGETLQTSAFRFTSVGTRATTALVYQGTEQPQQFNGTDTLPSNVFMVRDVPTTTPSGGLDYSNYPAAIAGYAFQVVQNGVYGRTSRGGFGVIGEGLHPDSIGVAAIGGSANLYLAALGAAVQTRTNPHLAGSVIMDETHSLWVCVTSGTPGTFRKLAGPTSAGAFHALTPGRVYDSRAAAPTPGPLNSGETRTVSVANRRDTTSGAVAEANFVPVGATAVSANVTVTETVNAGYLAINPGGVTAVNASAINWSGNGQNLANGLTLTLNGAREISVIAGGGGATDFIIDILGYYL